MTLYSRQKIFHQCFQPPATTTPSLLPCLCLLCFLQLLNFSVLLFICSVLRFDSFNDEPVEHLEERYETAAQEQSEQSAHVGDKIACRHPQVFLIF